MGQLTPACHPKVIGRIKLMSVKYNAGELAKIRCVMKANSLLFVTGRTLRPGRLHYPVCGVAG